MWTRFMDMHSGGGTKEPPYQYIYIEAPLEEAKVIFYNRFGHNPERVSCTCCGEDYSIGEHESFAQLTGYGRNCRNLVTPRDPETRLYLNNLPEIKAHLYLEAGEDPPAGFEVEQSPWRRTDEYRTVEQYIAREDVLVIPACEIRPQERHGALPQQGYVWVD